MLEPADVPRGTYILTTPGGGVGFNHDSPHWLDADDFEGVTRRILKGGIEGATLADAAELEGALRLRTGDLLAGLYDDWALRERERLRSIYLDALAFLLALYTRHEDIGRALECGRRILDEDPLREEVHREIMRLYLRSGRRGDAVRQFERCRILLEEELGVEPLPETRMLLVGLDALDGQRRAPGAADRHREIADQLRAARDGIDQARNGLDSLIRLFDGGRTSRSR